jgi:hypothetical protein
VWRLYQSSRVGYTTSRYRAAYRQWPALDSLTMGGLPSGVRAAAAAAGLGHLAIPSVDVDLACASRVVKCAGLLTPEDIRDVLAALDAVRGGCEGEGEGEGCGGGRADFEGEGETEPQSLSSSSPPLPPPLPPCLVVVDNNPDNKAHVRKRCTFLNDPPLRPFRTRVPHVMRKMLAFAKAAWAAEGWGRRSEAVDEAEAGGGGNGGVGGDGNGAGNGSGGGGGGGGSGGSGGVGGGPLRDVVGGMVALSVRVVELWEYDVGGGLVDRFHNDVDSVVTLVALLSDSSEFEGGVFRTYDPAGGNHGGNGDGGVQGDREGDGMHTRHPMEQGDVICFVSHKYHNITPVISGQRRSLVFELWMGDTEHRGR